MALPECGGKFAALPYRDTPYAATLDEIEQHFVVRAPSATRDRRALIMQALRLHTELVWRLAKMNDTTVKILLDGGFITWKHDKPKDADFAVLVPPRAYPAFVRPSRLSLWTLSDVGAKLGEDGEELSGIHLKPGFGLTDSYVNPDLASNRLKWHRNWSSARDLTTGDAVEGPQKGYVEVVRSDA